MLRLLCLPLLAISASALELHVSPSGKDTNPGSLKAPLLTLSAARDAARKVAGKEAVTVTVADGIYYLPETLVFTSADSGSEKFPAIYQAEHEGKAVISGGLALDLKWQPYRDGILQATTPEGLSIDQLFINGERQHMARYPNYDATKTTAAYQGFAGDAFSKERAAKWADPAGGYIHAMHAARWGGYEYRITGKNPDGTVAYEGGWQNNRQMGMHKDFRMVENIFEELDAPGEWFHNAKTRTLYFMPEVGTDPAKVEVVRLRHLVEFNGSQQSPVKHIALKGFTFRHAARTFMDTKEPLLRSDWTIYRGGAVLLTGTENVSILDSEFDQLGGNAVFVSHYNRRSLIKGCHIHDAGASGVCFVGDPKAVRNPLFEYAKSQDLTRIDRTPGPLTDNYPADCVVEDCLIHGIGRVERQPAGVQISMSSRITVRDCSIYDCARSGINIGDGTWGGHLIEGCDVFDTVLETHDHGSFNSWGRDRYWTSNHRGVSQPEVMKDPRLPFLDAIAPTVIRFSRWRCDHGWDIDLDDGSSNYEIHHNLLLNGGLKFREGYGRKAWNNVMVNSGFHPHVWFEKSGDELHSNLVMKSHADIGMPAEWGKLIDRNFFSSAADLAKARKGGREANSLAGDPMFIDPEKGDFRVKESSAALKVGFENFPMDRYGVKKPALKSIAKTPVIPALEMGEPAATSSEAKAQVVWLGATLHGLEGEEFSAFGTVKEDGGVQLVTVPQGSTAMKAGLLPNDLIQSIDGRKVVTTADLFKAIGNAMSSFKLRIVRNQASKEIELRNLPSIRKEMVLASGDFKGLVPSASPGATIRSRPGTSNDPLPSLLDGKLNAGYGPVFGNGVRGRYKVDLGAVSKVEAVTSWSHHQGGNRGSQFYTLYGSNSEPDPGWEVSDRSRFIPIGTVDTRGEASSTFVGTSLRAPSGQDLGRFRWIIWDVFPVTSIGENTAFQELKVESPR